MIPTYQASFSQYRDKRLAPPKQNKIQCSGGRLAQGESSNVATGVSPAFLFGPREILDSGFCTFTHSPKFVINRTSSTQYLCQQTLPRWRPAARLLRTFLLPHTSSRKPFLARLLTSYKMPFPNGHFPQLPLRSPHTES